MDLELWIWNYGLGISLMGRHTSMDSFPGIQEFLHGASVISSANYELWIRN